MATVKTSPSLCNLSYPPRHIICLGINSLISTPPAFIAVGDSLNVMHKGTLIIKPRSSSKKYPKRYFLDQEAVSVRWTPSQKWDRAKIIRSSFMFIFILRPNLLAKDQFRYFKIQPQTIDPNTRLWGINTEFVGLFPRASF